MIEDEGEPFYHETSERNIISTTTVVSNLFSVGWRRTILVGIPSGFATLAAATTAVCRPEQQLITNEIQNDDLRPTNAV